MEFNLKNLLQALLLSTSEAVSTETVQRVLTRYHEEHAQSEEEEKQEEGEEKKPEVPSLVTASDIREAIDSIRSDYVESNSVFRIIEGPQGFKLATAPEYSEWIRLLRNQPRPLRLSPAALETLSIIAYRQPVTRSEMETIRGVSVDSAVHKLLELELIHIMGRAELPGRPLQYGTTELFMEFAGIKSLEELPASDVVSRNQLDTWIRDAQNPEQISDSDVGLPSDEPTQSEIEMDSDRTEPESAESETVEEPEAAPEEPEPASEPYEPIEASEESYIDTDFDDDNEDAENSEDSEETDSESENR
ncbi:MAG: SMC-Scp complex subunit ScpB [Opitutales bacterium]